MDQIRRHFPLVFSRHYRGSVVAQALQVSEVDRPMHLFLLQFIRFCIVFVVTVVEFVAVNSVRVFESLEVHVYVLFQIAADAHHVGGIEVLLPVHQRLRFEGAQENIA